MKQILMVIVSATLSMQIVAQKTDKKSDTILLEPIEIKAVRAADKSPFTKTNLNKKNIDKVNLAQDLPYILKM